VGGTVVDPLGLAGAVWLIGSLSLVGSQGRGRRR